MDKRYPNRHTVFRWSLFLTIFLMEVAWSFFRHFYLQVPLTKNLPLHLCDFAFFISLLALALQRPILADLAYFIGIPSALLAIFFPVISESDRIGQIATCRFFITHIAILGAAIYLTFGRQYYPRLRSAMYSFLILGLYALLLVPVNLHLQSNYFFLREVPASAPAFIRNLPHAGYIAFFALLFLVVIGLLWLPFRGRSNTPPSWGRRRWRR